MVGEIKKAGLTVYPMRFSREKFSPIGLFKAILDVRNAALEMRAGVLHCVSLRCILLGWLATMFGLRSLRVVNHVIGMGSIFSEKPKTFRMRLQKSLVSFCLTRAFQKSFAHTVFQNQDDYYDWIKLAGLSTKQVSRIPGSIEWQDVKQNERGGARILYVGRMLRDKGINELLQAWQRLRAKVDNCELYMCGSIDPGNPNSFTEVELRNLSSSKGIFWLGRRNDVLDQMVKSDIVVLPTYREGFPKVLLEAGMTCRAVVTTDVPGCRDIVEHEELGLLVEPGNSHELYEALKRVCLDRELRQTLAMNLHDKVQSKFTDEAINPIWEKLYRQIN